MDVSVCVKHKQLAGQITTADTPDPRLQVREGLWDKPQLPADKLDHCYPTTQDLYRLAPSDHCLSHLIPVKRQACHNNRDKMDGEMKDLQLHPDCTGWDVFRETSADLDEILCLCLSDPVKTSQVQQQQSGSLQNSDASAEPRTKPTRVVMSSSWQRESKHPRRHMLRCWRTDSLLTPFQFGKKLPITKGLRSSIIVPVPKNQGVTLHDNYRPLQS